MNRMLGPTLVYDGECGFCRCWVARLRRLTGDAVVYRPYQDFQDYQEAAGDYPAMDVAAFAQAVQWIEAEGGNLSGADAVFRVLEYARWPFCRFGAWTRAFPGGMALCRWGYGVVARHRTFFSRWVGCSCE